MRKKGCRFESEGPARRTLASMADGLNRSATVPSTSSLLFPADGVATHRKRFAGFQKCEPRACQDFTGELRAAECPFEVDPRRV